MTFSTIITLYKRIDLVAIHLQEVMKSTRLPDEIIIINDGADIEFRDKLYKVPRKTKVIYARIDKDILWNCNGARNLGVWLSKGDVLLIEDTDYIPDKDLYKNVIEVFEQNPDIERVPFKRWGVSEEDVYSKPIEDWKKIANLNQCQMPTFVRRSLYLKLKGLDERFAGEAGWMEYDWVRRYKQNNTKEKYSGYCWVVFDGGEKVPKGMSKRNYWIYKHSADDGLLQHPQGILNFTYNYEIWDKNI